VSAGSVNPLSRFLGNDPGHAGANHWRAQRISALALMPLTLWFVYAMAVLPDYSFANVQAWLATPWRALPASLLVFCLAWHSKLGVQVVIEDYVHGRKLQSQTLALNTVVHVLLGVAGIVAALGMAFKD
jgi:succinate dehydrogenase / fumarate reductase membrane anchor subunit